MTELELKKEIKDTKNKIPCLTGFIFSVMEREYIDEVYLISIRDNDNGDHPVGREVRIPIRMVAGPHDPLMHDHVRHSYITVYDKDDLVSPALLVMDEADIPASVDRAVYQLTDEWFGALLAVVENTTHSTSSVFTTADIDLNITVGNIDELTHGEVLHPALTSIDAGIIHDTFSKFYEDYDDGFADPGNCQIYLNPIVRGEYFDIAFRPTGDSRLYCIDYTGTHRREDYYSEAQMVQIILYELWEAIQ